MSNNNGFDGFEEVKSSWAKFAKVGDYAMGTLCSAKQVANRMPGKEGEKQWVYEVKIDKALFHDIDASKQIIEPGMEPSAGEVWNVGGHFTMDSAMGRIKRGQKVLIRFEETKPAAQKGYSPMKVFKVATNGKMDEEWLKENEEYKSLEDEAAGR